MICSMIIRLMSTAKLQNYLASEEELLLSFTSESVEGNSEYEFQDVEYRFGATDRRIIYLTSDGSFKDIEYTHITSIESETSNQKPAVISGGCCGGIFLLGALSSFGDSPTQAIIGVLIGGGIIAGTYYIYNNSDETRKIRFITGDEADQQITATVSTDGSVNIAAELSSILRDQR